MGAAGFVAGRMAWRSLGSAAEPLHMSIRLAPNQEFGEAGGTTLVFSPDGTSLIFEGRENGRRLLLRRRLDSGEVEAIPGTDDAEFPFFSPDGRWIGFSSGGFLQKVPADGGRPFPLAEARGAGGACWLRDGTIVYAPIYSDGLFRVAAEGGRSERLTTPDHADGELGHWWPTPLPGERKVLFTAFHTPMDTSRIGVLDLGTQRIEWIVDGGFYATYLPTGHLIYAKGKRLYALPFDPERARPTGRPVALVDDVMTSQSSGFAEYAVSSRGVLAYATETLASPPQRLVWLDREGHASDALDERRKYQSVSLAPDGRAAALTLLGDSRDLWTYSFDRRTLSRLTTGAATEFGPAWSRDGRELFYVVDVPPFTLYRIGVGAPDSGKPLWEERAEVDTVQATPSADGRTLVFSRDEQGTGQNLYLRPIDGSAPPRALLATRATEQYPTLSPDGRWMAYESNETGRFEIYAEPLDGSGNRVQVSSDGGREPLWAANGDLFFRHDDEMRVVATHAGARLELEPTRMLFRAALVANANENMRTYDVTEDGSRILAIATPEESRPRQIEVVTGWTRQLPGLAPDGSQ